MSLTLFVRAADYPGDSSWRLAHWCFTRGATEFSLTFLVAGDPSPSSFATIDAALAEFRVAERDDHFVLSERSLGALTTLLPQGLFSDPSYIDGWIEDPTFYRSGVPLLQIISHEHAGILTIEPAEQATLDRAGLTYHLRGVWV